MCHFRMVPIEWEGRDYRMAFGGVDGARLRRLCGAIELFLLRHFRVGVMDEGTTMGPTSCNDMGGLVCLCSAWRSACVLL